MKAIDVCLTLTPEALGAVLARLDTAPPGTRGDICREAACAMKACAQYQRVVRECYESGRPLKPALKLAADVDRLIPPIPQNVGNPGGPLPAHMKEKAR